MSTAEMTAAEREIVWLAVERPAVERYRVRLLAAIHDEASRRTRRLWEVAK